MLFYAPSPLIFLYSIALVCLNIMLCVKKISVTLIVFSTPWTLDSQEDGVYDESYFFWKLDSPLLDFYKLMRSQGWGWVRGGNDLCLLLPWPA